MANTKVSALAALTGANVDNSADVLPIVDTSVTTSKKILVQELQLIVQNSQSTNYTLLITDANKHVLHPAADGNARTFTIPANASVAFVIGTTVTFVNETSNVVTIAITSDTMTLYPSGLTGSRSLAQYGMATALKLTATTWAITGVGLT